MPSVNEKQVGGSHYRAKIQHWDYTVRALGNRYLEGAITKYAMRHRKKNGLQDIQKAIHFCEKLKEEFAAGRIRAHVNTDLSFLMNDFVECNELNEAEAYIVKRLAHWYRPYHLDQVMATLRILEQQAVEREKYLEAAKAGAHQ